MTNRLFANPPRPPRPPKADEITLRVAHNDCLNIKAMWLLNMRKRKDGIVILEIRGTAQKTANPIFNAQFSDVHECAECWQAEAGEGITGDEIQELINARKSELTCPRR